MNPTKIMGLTPAPLMTPVAVLLL